jgi:hypothetical protein
MSYVNAQRTALESKHMKGRSSMKIRNLTSLLVLLLTAGLVLVCAPIALASEAHVFEGSFGPDGTAGTAFEAPGAVAVDQSNGETYVADLVPGTVQRLNAAHEPTLFSGLSARISGSDLTGFSFRTGEPMTQLAVDSGTHVLYVTNTKPESEHDGLLEAFQSDGEAALFTAGPGAGTNKIPGFEELCGVAVDANGDIYTADYRQGVHVFAPSGEPLATVSVEKAGCFLAVDSHGTVYVNEFQGAVEKLTPSAFPVTGATTYTAGATVDANTSTGVAVDPATSHLYVAEPRGAGSRLVEYDEAGTLLQTFAETGGGALSNSQGLAVDDFAAGKVLASDVGGKRQVEIWSPSLKLPDVSTGAASGASTTSVHLAGEVNPEGANVTSCAFEYGTTTSYGQSVPCVPGEPGAGIVNVSVSAQLTGLTPGAHYHYRLSAANANSPATRVFGADGTFSTGAHLESEFVSNVTDKTAVLDAAVNPQGAPAACRFQYVAQASFEASGYTNASTVPCAAPLGSGEGSVRASQTIEHLTPKSVYHYRVVLTSLGAEIVGLDQTFTTEGSGEALVLPDNRGWELVSPPNKQGALIEPLTTNGVVQAAASGNAIAYLAASPTEADPAGYANEVQVLSRRGVSGWSSHDLTLANAGAPGFHTGPQNRLFDPELTLDVTTPQGPFNPALSEDATEATPFIRDLAEGCTTNCLTPLVTGKPGIVDVPEGTVFGEDERCEPTHPSPSNVCGPTVVGASEDLSHVVLESPNTPLAAEGTPRELFEWNAGQLAAVSILPGSAQKQVSAYLGGDSSTRTPGAISTDGNRVVWSTEEFEAQSGLYMRDMARKYTLRLDQSAGCSGCTTGPGAEFQFASNDGARVFFTDSQHLTEDSGAQAEHGEKRDLYECQVVPAGEGLECELRDLTPAHGAESADVLGAVLGAASDGSSIYFVAEGVQSSQPNERGQMPVAGEPNLYVRHDGQTEFVVTLSTETVQEPGSVTHLPADGNDWGIMYQQPTRVSPNGRFVAFMSAASLTGYDNHDAATGQPAAEVYIYDAATRHLACASCEPTGVRPAAVEYRKLEPYNGGGLAGGPGLDWSTDGYVAATLPGWTAMGLLDGTWARHQPRYLTNDGRLFFNTGDPLNPQDVNDTQDVYEYEPATVGACGETSSSYVSQSGGCVALISSGRSSQESVFLDASESGDDVFFLTSERLSPLDQDAARDVYDAHVCSSASPCITFPVVQSPPCTTESSCKGSPTPQPPLFGAPASATFSGAGNPPPPTPAHTPAVKKKAAKCKKGLVKNKKGKCVRKKSKKRTKRATNDRRGK